VDTSLAFQEVETASEVGLEAEADSFPETVTSLAMPNGPSCPRLI
jgi:hypothetical protein